MPACCAFFVVCPPEKQSRVQAATVASQFRYVGGPVLVGTPPRFESEPRLVPTCQCLCLRILDACSTQPTYVSLLFESCCGSGLLIVLFVCRCLQAAARAAAVVHQSDHSALHSLPEAQLRMCAEQVGLALVAAAVAVLQGVMSCLSSR